MSYLGSWRLWLWAIVVLLGILSLAALFWADVSHYSMVPMRSFYYAYFFPLFPFSFLGFFLILLLIFAAFGWLFWGWGWWHDGHRGRYWDEAHHILRLRYAKGEITKEQYEQMLRDLDPHS
jgi:putative membrane protein